MSKTLYITKEQALTVHHVLVDFFETDGDPISPPGIKSEHLLESALFRPQTEFSGVEKYNSIDKKAAALLCAIIQNHPFHNGNKRTALLCTLMFYENTGHTIDAKENEIYEFLISIAKNKVSGVEKTSKNDFFFDEIVKWLRKRRYSYRKHFKDMKTKNFIAQCKKMGASIKYKGGNCIISHDGKSISISESTRQIGSGIIRSYLSELKLSPVYSGIKFDQFVSNGIENLSCFTDLLSILRRLALV